MSPILTGVIASGVSGQLNTWSPQGAYDSLATITLSSAASSVTFTGIPTGYKHLQLRMLQRDSNANTNVNSLYMYYNGSVDSSSYAWHRIEAVGSGSPTSSGAINQGSIWIGPSAANNYTTGIFAGHIVDILDYASTTKFKTSRHLGGFDTNATGTEPGEIAFTSGLFMNPNPITSLTIFKSGQNQIAGSTFALYGVK